MTPISKSKLPEGMHQLSPHLICKDADKAIDFYKAAFGAIELNRMLHPNNGTIMHAALVINGSSVLLMEEAADWGALSPKALGGTPITIHLIVEDADASAEQAVAAGGTLAMPVQDMFWGDRYGVIKDPYGHSWAMSTPQKSMTMDEIADAAKDTFAQEEARPAQEENKSNA